MTAPVLQPTTPAAPPPPDRIDDVDRVLLLVRSDLLRRVRVERIVRADRGRT